MVANSKDVQSNPYSVTVTVTPSSSSTPPAQNGSSITNSNVNSLNNGQFIDHNTINTYNFNGHGGNSISSTGSANGGQEILRDHSDNGGQWPSTSTAGNGGNIYRNSDGTGGEGSVGTNSMSMFSNIP